MGRLQMDAFDWLMAKADAEAEEHENLIKNLREQHPELEDWELEKMVFEQEYERCGCSDPGCPCSGPKRSGPI